ncbi:MAG: MotA/TolQ/ExbB proton channel family protein [Deltaproteobacteria bacterium]
MKHHILCSSLLALGIAAPTAAHAQAPSLDALLAKVKKGYREDGKELAAREAEFKRDRDKQAKLLADAKKALAAAEARSTALERKFQDNEVRLTELEATLRTRLGTMGELFGVVRQVAGDTVVQLDTSMVSSQLPGRGAKIEKLAQSEALPSIQELEHLWFTLQQEMTESGKVVRYSATVIDDVGKKTQQEVVRVGTFNAIANGGYLQYLPDVQQLAVLARQPADRYLSAVRELEGSSSGFVRFPLDPSRGAILGLLIETPSVEERVQLGGVIGYVVLGLGAFALLIGLLRFFGLLLTDVKIRAQLRSKTANDNNPVGRVLKAFEANRHLSLEDLERKLDEVIVREAARLDRFLWIVKVVAVSAPLLGLLGTVTGMIRTFQAITLFGTGDPKLMAGGISEALVTTMLGLVTAIPLVLIHAMLQNLSRRMQDIVDEQAAGVVATRAEENAAPKAPPPPAAPPAPPAAPVPAGGVDA